MKSRNCNDGAVSTHREEIEETGIRTGRMYIRYGGKNGGDKNTEQDIVLEHSLSVLDSILNGSRTETYHGRGYRKRESVRREFGKFVEPGNLPVNTAYQFLTEHPTYIGSLSFNNGFKPTCREDLEKMISDAVLNRNSKGFNREDEQAVFKTFNFYKKRVHKIAFSILERNRKDADSRNSITELVEAYAHTKVFYDGIAEANLAVIPICIGLFVKKFRPNAGVIEGAGDSAVDTYLSLIQKFNADEKTRFMTFASNIMLRELNQVMGKRKTPEINLLDYMQPIIMPCVDADDREFRGYIVSRVIKENEANLDDRERYIIKRRFGFNCDTETLQEIGTELGLTRERVRQIEKQAIEKVGRELFILHT